ncbi:MAG: aminotransferase class V-fold PLP-dependent enzyme [Rubricoccaceae bacterium]|nr:aminotransferase class V-fold PLP-dependent enzyme [Rubricoccaceae bacterium]
MDPIPLPLPASEIPALAVPEGEERPCYLDSAATSLKPRAVVDRIARFYAEENAPVHRGVYVWSQRATDLYEEARRTVAAFVGADPEGLVFTRGTTEGLNLVARAWAEERLRPGDAIVASPQEHHSNITPWQEVARRTGAHLHFAPLRSDGTLDLDGTLGLLGRRTRLVALAHVSNVLGIENPVREVFESARRLGALTVLDGAQSVPTRPVDVTDLHCDVLTFSGHKMLGPTGIGALAAPPDLLGAMAPYQTGGGMIERVAVEGTTFLDGFARYEAGTPHAAGAVGLAAACAYLSALTYHGKQGMEAVAAYERDWGRRAIEGLQTVEGLRLLGPPGDAEPEGGIVTLQMAGVHPHDLAVLLDAQGVMCRAGHHCTMPLHAHLGEGGAWPDTSLRASAYVYNPFEDADRLVGALAFAGEALTRRRTGVPT